LKISSFFLFYKILFVTNKIEKNEKMKKEEKIKIIQKYFLIYSQQKNKLENETKKLIKIEEKLKKGIKNYFNYLYFSKEQIINNETTKTPEPLKTQKENLKISLINGETKRISIYNPNDIKSLLLNNPNELLDNFLIDYSKLINVKKNITSKYTFTDFLQTHLTFEKKTYEYSDSLLKNEFQEYKESILTETSREIDPTKYQKIKKRITKKENLLIHKKIKIILLQDLYKEQSNNLHEMIRKLKEKNNQLVIRTMDQQETTGFANVFEEMLFEVKKNFVLTSSETNQCIFNFNFSFHKSKSIEKYSFIK
jgi:hypothetical protein